MAVPFACSFSINPSSRRLTARSRLSSATTLHPRPYVDAARFARLASDAHMAHRADGPNAAATDLSALASNPKRVGKGLHPKNGKRGVLPVFRPRNSAHAGENGILTHRNKAVSRCDSRFAGAEKSSS
jgi:hypothetical protein